MSHQEILESFTADVISTDKVWGLKGEDGWAVCESIEFEETDVLLFFATEEAAAKLCVDEWQAYEPASLTLDEFLQDWLPGMHEDNAMVGIQWDADLDGPELEPADVDSAFARLLSE